MGEKLLAKFESLGRNGDSDGGLQEKSREEGLMIKKEIETGGGGVSPGVVMRNMVEGYLRSFHHSTFLGKKSVVFQGGGLSGRKG